MTCREVAEFILDYVDGELPAATREVFQRHLAVCPNCREYIALYLASVEFGRHAFDDDRAAREAGIPDDLVAAILSARPQ
jgi:anti-sigma factor RsiW